MARMMMQTLLDTTSAKRRFEMLYDPKWEIEIKADPFSLDSLIAWLEKQPANETYAWHCQGQCMLGQWLKYIDPRSGEADGDSFQYFVNGEVHDFNKYADIAMHGDANFGAALERARAAAASRT
jgi:hypothetical protein